MKEQKLLYLLKKKKGLFEAVLDLTETESFLNIKEWQSVLKQKKILLSCIEDIDKQLSIFKDSFQNFSQEVTDELEFIHHLIIKILDIDMLNQLERRKELLAYEKRAC